MTLFRHIPAACNGHLHLPRLPGFDVGTSFDTFGFVGEIIILDRVAASMDLMRQSSESLAGGIGYTGMHGLNVAEIDRNQQGRQTLWLRGGFLQQK